MEMPLADVYDRLSILALKKMHGLDVTDEIVYYSQDGLYVDYYFLELLHVNYEIWKLESDIRAGRLDEILDLDKIGQRALAIRDWNKKRIEIKNKIAMEQGLFVEVKVAHASS
jgi:hypothetical protein